jgi:hypothetical protein
MIRMDSHHFGNNLNPHQIKILIRIRIWSRVKVISWIRIRINLQMTSKNLWKMRLFEHFFKGLTLSLNYDLDPDIDQHQNEKSDITNAVLHSIVIQSNHFRSYIEPLWKRNIILRSDRKRACTDVPYFKELGV